MRSRNALPCTFLAALVSVGPAWAQQEPTLAEGAQVYAATCGRCHNPRAPGERSDREWGVIMLHMRTRGNLSGREARAALFFLQSTNVDAGGDQAAAPERDQPARVATWSGGSLPVDVFEGSAGGPKARWVAWPRLPRQDAARVEEGRKLIEQSGCVACHKVAKQTSGTLGPDLNTVFKRRDADYIRQKLANPKFDNAASTMPQMPLTPEQQAAIIEYLRSIQK